MDKLTNTQRYVILAIAVILIGGAIYYLNGMKAHPGGGGTPGPVTIATPTSSSTPKTADFTAKAKQYPPAPELVAPDGYINTDGQPITIGSLIGKKVILLDFWTYSCINCQRTIPYLNAWYQKYKDDGLEIIGVHTPEFDFEKNITNVQTAVKNFGIQYPVVLDNEYATWDAYHNEYWPEEYLIDINGLVVDRKIGEGNYADTEKEIQTLLEERKTALNATDTIPTTVTDVDTPIYAQSPETYFGYERNQYLANGSQQTPGIQTLTLPSASSIEPNMLYLSGTWNFNDQYAENASSGAEIEFQYDAKNVYFVASAAKGVTVTVLRDGVPVGSFKGNDVDANGNVTIEGSRLYSLVNETTPGTHTLELIVNGGGLDAYTFTFG